MKIVIISDVHGNYDSLTALPESYDELWVLGDLANYGPQPSEVVDWIAQKAAIVIRGNHDHSIGFHEDPRCAPRYRAMAEATGKISDAALSDMQKQYLRNLPLTVREKRQNTRFYLVHAIPSDPLYGYCPQDSDRWVAEAADVNADVLLVGHTHTLFVRRIGNRTVVNPGSLGQPKTGKPDACYAIWEDGVIQLKTYPYPVERTVQKIQSLSVQDDIKQDLITVLRTGSVDAPK